MIENLDELTSEQKNDLQEFVSIAYKNLDLWWVDKDKQTPKLLDLVERFGYIIDINSLNEILIDFSIMVYDVYSDSEIEKVLQLQSEEQCARDVGFMVTCPLGRHAFRFKKCEDMVNMVPQNISNPSKFDTKLLLEELQNVLIELKGDFGHGLWREDI